MPPYYGKIRLADETLFLGGERVGIKQSLRNEDLTEECYDVLVTKVPLSLTIQQKTLIDRLRRESAGADPGEIHALTLSDGENHLIITAKELRSLYRQQNRVTAKLSRKISRKQKGSTNQGTSNPQIQ